MGMEGTINMKTSLNCLNYCWFYHGRVKLSSEIARKSPFFSLKVLNF